MSHTLNLTVQGMTCSNCVAHVTEALEGVDGVNKVMVELNAGADSIVTVVTDDIDATDEADLTEAVTEAGYTVTGVQH